MVMVNTMLPELQFLKRSVAILLLVVLQSCKSQPLREWMPADHDDESPNKSGQVAPPQPSADSKSASATDPSREEQDIVAEAAWRNFCLTCHGFFGRGDGPEAAMFNPPDLTTDSFRASRTDEEIVRIIHDGYGRMKGFPSIPTEVAFSLVKRLRTAAVHVQGSVKPPLSGSSSVTSGSPSSSSSQAAKPLPPR